MWEQVRAWWFAVVGAVVMFLLDELCADGFSFDDAWG